MGLHLGLIDLGIPHEIYGVDIEYQTRYPFMFVQADAFALPFDLREFDFVWASPNCEGYSELTPPEYRQNYAREIPRVRRMVKAAGVRYAIENVSGARADLVNPVMLCGTMFNLNLWRHRYFELSNGWNLTPPCLHHIKPVVISGRPGNGIEPNVQERRAAMQTEWMSIDGIDKAIPPAYARHIIKQVIGT